VNISQKGIDLIKRFEGCRLKSYTCPAGVLTIGYGHTGSDVTPNMQISLERAENMLKMDLIIHCNNVSKLVKVPLTQNQFDALVSFEYNVGYGALRTSTLLKLLNQGKYKEASEQFERWAYAGGKPLEGLKKRRKAEKELFLGS
jgi:lysozyme